MLLSYLHTHPVTPVPRDPGALKDLIEKAQHSLVFGGGTVASRTSPPEATVLVTTAHDGIATIVMAIANDVRIQDCFNLSQCLNSVNTSKSGRRLRFHSPFGTAGSFQVSKPVAHQRICERNMNGRFT